MTFGCYGRPSHVYTHIIKKQCKKKYSANIVFLSAIAAKMQYTNTTDREHDTYTRRVFYYNALQRVQNDDEDNVRTAPKGDFSGSGADIFAGSQYKFCVNDAIYLLSNRNIEI